jgi:hypothetical protein
LLRKVSKAFILPIVVAVQEDLILDVVDDVGLTTEELLETKVFINSSDDNTSTLGGYKFFSKGLTLGVNFTNILQAFLCTKVFYSAFL